MTSDLHRQPNDTEIEAVLNAFDVISARIHPREGTISAANWREVYRALASLNAYELWLGVCNLESAIFDSEDPVTITQITLYELFTIAYEHGIEAL